MFDRSASGGWRHMAAPRVDLASLHALARLLEDADASSQSAAMGAALVVHAASWRDVVATPVDDPAVGSVLRPTQGEDGGDAAMVGAAGRDAPGPDNPSGTALRRPRKRHEHLPTEGGPSLCMRRSGHTIWTVKRSCMSDSRRSIRRCTIARAAHLSTPCAIGYQAWDDHTSRPCMRSLAVRLPAA